MNRVRPTNSIDFVDTVDFVDGVDTLRLKAEL
jgi:hypothetical protein